MLHGPHAPHDATMTDNDNNDDVTCNLSEGLKNHFPFLSLYHSQNRSSFHPVMKSSFHGNFKISSIDYFKIVYLKGDSNKILF